MTDQDYIVHQSPFPDWFAFQDTSSRGIWICDRASDRKVKFEPPAEWGRDWSWNLTEDGSGIYFTRDLQ